MKMKKRSTGFFSALFLLLGFCAAAAGIWLALNQRDSAPVMLREPEAARTRAVSMLDSLCAGDYAGVSACLRGQPSLGLDREAQSPVGQLIWLTFSQSFSYTLDQQIRATDSGVAMDVTISCLELGSVTENLGAVAQRLLEERVAQAEDVDEVYDENYEYREEIVMEVLLAAAQIGLEQDARTTSRTVTLELVHENGQWWIVPDSQVLGAISGGILG